MSFTAWVLLGALLVAAGICALAVFAALAGRSQQPQQLTPTQQTENPYRRIYPAHHK